MDPRAIYERIRSYIHTCIYTYVYEHIHIVLSSLLKIVLGIRMMHDDIRGVCRIVAI